VIYFCFKKNLILTGMMKLEGCELFEVLALQTAVNMGQWGRCKEREREEEGKRGGKKRKRYKTGVDR
jgi:hypothetical protein